MRKNRNFLRLCRIMAVLMLALSAVFVQGALPVSAEAITEIPLSEVYFFYSADGGYVVDNAWSVAWGRWELNDKPGFCIEPAVYATFDDVYSAEDIRSYDGLSMDVKQRLADISHFGYNSEHSSEMDWIATQLMIWIAVDPVLSGTVVYVQEGSSHMLTDGVEITSDVQEIIDRIENDISAYHTEPQLEIYNATADQYLDPEADEIEACVEDEIIITDKAGVFSDYEIKENSSGDADVTKDGNTLRLQFHSAGADQELTFLHLAADEDSEGTVFFYRAPGSQSLMSAGAASDAMRTSLNFKAVGVDLHITKASSQKLLALEGASLGLYEDADENGIYDEGEPLVEEFLSGVDEYTVRNLIPGRHYVLHEIDAPNGYTSAEDIAFFPQREDAETGLSCQMIDEAFTVIVRKNTQRNDRIADVELSIIDAETGEIARNQNGEEAVYKTMADTDWDCSKYLQEGKTYILRETELVGGVFKSADVVFTAPKAGDPVLYVAVTMTDQTYQVHVRKVDNTENASIVPDIVLTLYETGEEETELASHKTDAKEEYWDITEYVRAGKTYRLKETETAPGYYLSDDIVFDIPEAEKLQEDDYIYEITMVDDVHNAVYGKKDEDGTWIEGAIMLILDEEMEERRKEAAEEKEDFVQGEDYLYRFVSKKEGTKTDENGEEIKLYSDRTYYLHEEKAPFGFVPSEEDVPFTVTGTLEMVQEVYMTDLRQDVFISVYKYDADEKEKPLKDAEFAVYRKKDDKEIARGTTDEKGEVSFVVPYEEEGYYILETKAPSGYQKDSHREEVLIEEESCFSQKTPLVYTFYNRTVVDTSAAAPAATAFISVLALALFMYLQKKHV